MAHRYKAGIAGLAATGLALAAFAVTSGGGAQVWSDPFTGSHHQATLVLCSGYILTSGRCDGQTATVAS